MCKIAPKVLDNSLIGILGKSLKPLESDQLFLAMAKTLKASSPSHGTSYHKHKYKRRASTHEIDLPLNSFISTTVKTINFVAPIPNFD